MAIVKTYTIHSSIISHTGGRYKSSSPMAGAKKAASVLFRMASKDPKHKSLKKISFCLRETTVNSDKNMIDFTATRKKLVKPVIRIINGVEIINKFETKVVMKKNTHSASSSKSKVKGGFCGCNK